MSVTRQLERELLELLDPTVVDLGYELVAVEMTTVEGQPTLRVSADRAGGIDVSDLKKLTHAISPVLDAEDPIEAGYNLEVSSPGIERPVQRARDFARFVGFEVRVRLAPGAERRRYRGRITGCESGRVALLVDGVDHVLELDDVERAHLVLSLQEYQQLAEEPPPRVELDDGGVW